MSWAEWVCDSQYVAVRDGTRLAAYIFRPAVDGVAVPDPLPVVWTHNRYHGQRPAQDRVQAWREKFSWLVPAPAAEPTEPAISIADVPWLQEVLAHGYVIVFIDVRGAGASFGASSGPLSPEEARDAYDIIEWLASQTWCDGAVGMFGRSYMGTNQCFAAAEGPPHLRAVFPEMALFDLYSFVVSGGVFRHDFARNWTADLAWRDGPASAVAVDEDTTGVMLRAAREEHLGNRDVYEMFSRLPFRDSIDPVSGERPYVQRNPAHDGTKSREPNVPAYILAGWWDPFVRDAFAWFANISGPKKLVVGPWAHSGSAGFDLGEEHVRWFDRWLKLVDDASEEAPIQYYTIGAPPGQRWRVASEWPLPNAKPTPFFLSSGPTATVGSINDGALAATLPTDDATDEYAVNGSTTSGSASRWTNAYGGPFAYPDMTGNDEKGLTYTTPPLAGETEITGHPILHLWVMSTAEDCDFFGYLEEVTSDGVSTYVSEGVLRASHRRSSEPPFKFLGLPYHRSFAEDIVALPRDRAVELVFDLQPISRVFQAGHRIRLTITCADRDNALALDYPAATNVRVHRGTSHPSRLVLPVVSQQTP